MGQLPRKPPARWRLDRAVLVEDHASAALRCHRKITSVFVILGLSRVGCVVEVG